MAVVCDHCRAVVLVWLIPVWPWTSVAVVAVLWLSLSRVAVSWMVAVLWLFSVCLRMCVAVVLKPPCHAVSCRDPLWLIGWLCLCGTGHLSGVLHVGVTCPSTEALCGLSCVCLRAMSHNLALWTAT